MCLPSREQKTLLFAVHLEMEEGHAQLNQLLEKAELYAQFVADETNQGARQQQSKLASVSKDSSASEPTPSILRFSLRDYQLEGMNWIINLWKNGEYDPTYSL